MIRMGYDDVLEKIQENTTYSKVEIEDMIEKKLKQLSGLISKEGAAHIVANQLGIKLIAKTSGKLQIKNVLTGMRDVEVVGKVLRIYPARHFMVDGRKGQVSSLVVGDETGTIRVVMWGDQADNIQKTKEGMIIKIMGAYVREKNKVKELHMANKSSFVAKPKGETVGEVKEYNNTGNRKRLKDLEEGEDNVEIIGTIVQVFDPKFYVVCPSCGKKVVQRDGDYFCEEHDVIEPNYSYVINVFLDDGSENIRVVCFRNQALRLLGIDEKKMQDLRKNSGGFEVIKTEILGNIVKFGGRVVKNQMFDRLEFIVRFVYPNPDPEEELNYLNKEMEKIKSEKSDIPSIDSLENIED